MRTSIQFTEADRDERGFIRLSEPRSLASLLPQTGAPPTPSQQRPASKAERISMAVVACILIGMVVWRFASSGDAAPAAPPRAPATIPATALPSPVSRLPSPVPVAMLPAYSAPGVPLGQIEATRPITVVAHFGQDWIAYRDGSGLVWLRASDWPLLTIAGPDLAPPPTATPAPYVPPTATPPPPCAAAGLPGKMIEVCDYDSLDALQARARDQWLATYGGNAGVVTTPTPYGGTK